MCNQVLVVWVEMAAGRRRQAPGSQGPLPSQPWRAYSLASVHGDRAASSQPRLGPANVTPTREPCYSFPASEPPGPPAPLPRAFPSFGLATVFLATGAAWQRPHKDPGGQGNCACTDP